MANRRRPWWGPGPTRTSVRTSSCASRTSTETPRIAIGRNQSVAQVLGYMNLLYNAT